MFKRGSDATAVDEGTAALYGRLSVWGVVGVNRTSYETTVFDGAPASLRVEYGRTGGRVVYFVVLLFYYVTGVPGRGTPCTVVGFDHDERGDRTPHRN